MAKFTPNAFFPKYDERLRKNIQPVIEAQGFIFNRGLQNMTRRQLYRIRKGQSSVTIQKLQKIADEIGVDMTVFFRKPL
jgi:transcriptional regulator with XRE-family HTH domain